MEDFIPKFAGIVIVVGGALLWALSFMWPLFVLGGIGCWLRGQKAQEPAPVQPRDDAEEARLRAIELQDARKRILAEHSWDAGAN